MQGKASDLETAVNTGPKNDLLAFISKDLQIFTCDVKSRLLFGRKCSLIFISLASSVQTLLVCIASKLPFFLLFLNYCFSFFSFFFFLNQ